MTSSTIIMQGDIKYHFLSHWYDPTRDWTPVSQAIGEHSTHLDNGLVGFITFPSVPIWKWMQQHDCSSNSPRTMSQSSLPTTKSRTLSSIWKAQDTWDKFILLASKFHPCTKRLSTIFNKSTSINSSHKAKKERRGEIEREVDVGLSDGVRGFWFWLWLCVWWWNQMYQVSSEISDHMEVELILVN